MLSICSFNVITVFIESLIRLCGLVLSCGFDVYLGVK